MHVVFNCLNDGCMDFHFGKVEWSKRKNEVSFLGSSATGLGHATFVEQAMSLDSVAQTRHWDH